MAEEPPPEHEHPHDDSEHRLAVFESVEVSERGDDLVGIAASANEGTTGLEQLSLRPKLRAGDLIETVPGAVATQHSGGGKANQYFLRGFNLDHGTDFAVTVAGTLTQVLAEVLAGVAYSQLIRPGAPVIFGAFVTSIDMNSGAPTFGTPEAAQIDLICTKVLSAEMSIPVTRLRSSNSRR